METTTSERDEDLLMLCRMVAAYEKVRDWDEKWLTGQNPEPVTEVEKRGCLAIVSLSYKEEMARDTERVQANLRQVTQVVAGKRYLAGEMAGCIGLGMMAAALVNSKVPYRIQDIDFSKIDESRHERIKQKGRDAGLWPLKEEDR